MSPTAVEPNPQSEQDLRAAMMRRLGIAEDASPEPGQPHLKVVPPVEAPAAEASDEQQLEDMLSRFGIDERPQSPRRAPREEPQVLRAEPPPVRVAEFDIPAAPLRVEEPAPVSSVPAPSALAQPEPAAEAEPASDKPTQDEMLQELRRQLKGSRMTAKSRRGVAVPPIAIPAPTKAQKRRAMGEMAYTRLVIWVLAIIASGLMTYNIVKASVEHDRALGRPSFVETFRGT